MTEQKEQQIKFSIVEGEPFFSHDMSINFNPSQFIFDFRCVTPRIDPRTNDGSRVMQLKHNIVMLEPYHAKQVAEVLADMVKKYEKRFGKISKSKAISKMENEAKKTQDQRSAHRSKASNEPKSKSRKDEGKTGEFPRY